MAKEDVAMQVLQQVVKLPVVKVNRSKFLMDKFSKKVASKDIPRLLEEGPTALLPKETLDQVANACIKDNVLLASGTSVLAGLPGGIAMAVTIPTDVAQFYAFSLKLAQELGYIYGYDDLWASRNELSEEAKNTLLLYLGVMLGVNGAGALLRSGGVTVALKIFGVNLTKGGLAKGMGKVIPILGGVLSGGLTFATMKPMGERLQKELSKLINYDEAQYQRDVATIQKEVKIIEGE